MLISSRSRFSFCTGTVSKKKDIKKIVSYDFTFNVLKPKSYTLMRRSFAQSLLDR